VTPLDLLDMKGILAELVDLYRARNVVMRQRAGIT
jgi:hypothetical protein